MLRIRANTAAALLAISFAMSGPAAGAVVAAEPEETPTATLDGRPIPLADVSKYYCDDFAYPQIRCSVTPLLPTARATVTTLLTGVDYVTIYDGTSFSGSMMNVAEDYPALALIGWNDKVSSIKGRNSETGRFWTDWFNGGTPWAFCCNQQVSNLGFFSNVFSAVERT